VVQNYNITAQQVTKQIPQFGRNGVLILASLFEVLIIFSNYSYDKVARLYISLKIMPFRKLDSLVQAFSHSRKELEKQISFERKQKWILLKVHVLYFRTLSV